MKTPADASQKVDGQRHQKGMEIDDNAVKVYTARTKSMGLVIIAVFPVT